ncbi:MAG: peptidase M50 [Candidatus Fimenecus sp.]
MQITVRGVKVKVSFWFAVLLCFLLTCTDNTVLCFAVLFSLLHECGHLLCDFLFREKPQKIEFGLFGLTIVRADDICFSYQQEICEALAGPAVNFLLFLLFLLLYVFYRSETVFTCCFVNLYIFLFNAMPVFSLDGGRAFWAFLCKRIDNPETQLKIQKVVSFFCILGIMGFGFFVLLRSRYNFTLLLLAGYLMITLFVKC